MLGARPRAAGAIEAFRGGVGAAEEHGGQPGNRGDPALAVNVDVRAIEAAGEQRGDQPPGELEPHTAGLDDVDGPTDRVFTPLFADLTDYVSADLPAGYEDVGYRPTPAGSTAAP